MDAGDWIALVVGAGGLVVGAAGWLRAGRAVKAAERSATAAESSAGSAQRSAAAAEKNADLQEESLRLSETRRLEAGRAQWRLAGGRRKSSTAGAYQHATLLKYGKSRARWVVITEVRVGEENRPWSLDLGTIIPGDEKEIEIPLAVADMRPLAPEMAVLLTWQDSTGKNNDWVPLERS